MIEVKDGAPSRVAGPLVHRRARAAEVAVQAGRRQQARPPAGDRGATGLASPTMTFGPGTPSRFPMSTSPASPRGHALLGPDASPTHARRRRVRDADATRRALERAWTAGSVTAPAEKRSRGRARADQRVPGPDRRAPTTPAPRRRGGPGRLLPASSAQLQCSTRTGRGDEPRSSGRRAAARASIAVEKACRLAREGLRTLFVCFNQPLATAVLREVEEARRAADRRPHVSTFHRLCETLEQRAGALGAAPSRSRRTGSTPRRRPRGKRDRRAP